MLPSNDRGNGNRGFGCITGLKNYTARYGALVSIMPLRKYLKELQAKSCKSTIKLYPLRVAPGVHIVPFPFCYRFVFVPFLFHFSSVFVSLPFRFLSFPFRFRFVSVSVIPLLYCCRPILFCFQDARTDNALLFIVNL